MRVSNAKNYCLIFPPQCDPSTQRAVVIARVSQLLTFSLIVVHHRGLVIVVSRYHIRTFTPIITLVMGAVCKYSIRCVGVIVIIMDDVTSERTGC